MRFQKKEIWSRGDIFASLKCRIFYFPFVFIWKWECDEMRYGNGNTILRNRTSVSDIVAETLETVRHLRATAHRLVILAHPLPSSPLSLISSHLCIDYSIVVC